MREYVILCLIFTSCSTWNNYPHEYGTDSHLEQTDDNEILHTDGRCLAKSWVPAQYETDTLKYWAYTGDRTDTSEYIYKDEVQVSPASTIWVKKRVDNCRSTDEDDCLVWCLQEVPAEYVELLIVEDTTRVKDFEIKEVSYTEKTAEAGLTEWVEVICREFITPQMVKAVQHILHLEGYYKGDISGESDIRTKIALRKYQQANGLPIGQFDFETLNKMGVKYD